MPTLRHYFIDVVNGSFTVCRTSMTLPLWRKETARMAFRDRDLLGYAAKRGIVIGFLLAGAFALAIQLDNSRQPKILPRVLGGTACEVQATCVLFEVTDTDTKPFVGPEQDSDPLHVITTTTVVMRDETEGGVQSVNVPLTNSNVVTTSLGFVPQGAVQEEQKPTSVLTVYPVVVEDSGGDPRTLPNTYEVTTYEIENLE